MSLLTDLFSALKNNLPSSLSSVPVANSTAGIDACVRLAEHGETAGTCGTAT